MCEMKLAIMIAILGLICELPAATIAFVKVASGGKDHVLPDEALSDRISPGNTRLSLALSEDDIHLLFIVMNESIGGRDSREFPVEVERQRDTPRVRNETKASMRCSVRRGNTFDLRMAY